MTEDQKSTLAAINIVNVKTNIILSKHIPIIFDWNGEGDIITSIIKDNEFFDYLKSIDIFTINQYAWATLCMSYFGRAGEDDLNDDYKDIRFNMQILFSLKDLEDRDIDLTKQYLFVIYASLYKRAFNNTEYLDNIGATAKDFDISKVEYSQIIEIHNKIRAKYGESFLKTTELNYVRSQLIKKYELHDVIAQYVIDKLDTMIT